jgi:hypothetical protein
VTVTDAEAPEGSPLTVTVSAPVPGCVGVPPSPEQPLARSAAAAKIEARARMRAGAEMGIARVIDVRAIVRCLALRLYREDGSRVRRVTAGIGIRAGACGS